MRVVSLLPSATELCYAIGVEPVGVSHGCDYPPAAAEKPVVNHSRVDPDASSAEINQQVAAAEAGGGVYELDREILAELDPDVILSQGICAVCAVDDSAVRRAVADLDLDCDVVATDPHSLGDVLDDVERVGEVLGRADRAASVRADLEARVEAVRRDAVERAGEPPTVAVLDWLDPVMVAGHWVPELVELAGGRYELEVPGAHSRPREWVELRDADPDVIVVSPCGFGVEQTLANATDLADRPGWADLTAVRDGRVSILDGHHYVNRPGPRLVDTLEFLADILIDTRPDPPAAVARPWPGLDRPADSV